MTEIYKDHMSETFKFGDLVVVEMVMAPDEKRVGRLVQVRKGVGAFGMDMYIIRLHDGSYQTFDNVKLRKANDIEFENNFYRFNGRTPPEVKDEDSYPEDEPDLEYTIMGVWPETGFIVADPKQPNSETQSFSMVIMSEKEND